MTHQTGQPETGTQSDESLGALIATASRDLSALVRGEIELAKTEVRQEVMTGVKGGAMFGAAAFLSLLAVVLLSIAFAQGLIELGVVPWLAYLIVTIVYLLVAGVLVLVGKRAVSRVGPPERTIRTSKETAAFLKSPRSGNGTSPTT
jgi:hypothetical protein